MYHKVSSEDIDFFVDLLADRCLFSQENKEKYSRDETEDLSYPPELVLKPKTSEEISKILSYCNQKLIPVTPAGARTGLSGGALAIHGGVLLSMELFNKILKIDEENYQVITEPGVITEDLQNTLKEKGLFYPPDPASKGSCFIGGNVAENSGGPKAVKYGVTSDYVLNLEVVLATGEIIWTGANVLKNATGYNLTQLMVGSEGTLGIVTKIVLKLIPHPTRDMLMLVPFFEAEEACKAVAAIFNAGITPSGLEFMERDALLLSQQMINNSTISIKDKHQAHLLIESDGFEEGIIMAECEKIMHVLENFNTDEILFAESEAQKSALWALRRKVGEAVKSKSIYKEEDTVVPRYALPELLKEVKSIGNDFGFESICYGHAGDGNLHVNILKGDLSDEKWEKELPTAIKKLFIKVKSLGGTLSGEHGIGLVQKQYMEIFFSKSTILMMKNIKKIFDPNLILNPGKIFPD
ncbi:MAG: FAD-linked oxidase C-terminal domain-containing protein [Crocinitomicaceae bacterium]|nr:FAD-linked oxidase C-terminal domain-containing protein [Crocinitomicaceae bacterium]